MHEVLWVVQGVLALGMIGAGAYKAFNGKEGITPPRGKMTWALSFEDRQIRAIGALELVAALGLILPGLLGILPVLTPIAAVGIVVLMAGATATHMRLREPLAASAPSLVMLALAVVVAIGRLALAPMH